MRDNKSETIQMIAQVFRWLFLVSGVVVFIALLATEGTPFAIALLPLIYGLILFGLFTALYGFGCLIEDTAAIRGLLEKKEQDKAKEKVSGTGSAARPAQSTPVKKENSAAPGNSLEKATATTTGSVSPRAGAAGNTIICPTCGREQRADRNVCYNCGVRFLKDGQPEQPAQQ